MFLQTLVLIEYRRVTDGQTDGVGIASTALGMRALRRTVKTVNSKVYSNITKRLQKYQYFNSTYYILRES